LRAVPEGHAAFEGGYRRRRNLHTGLFPRDQELDPTIVIGVALAAIIGGVVVLGSNSSTSKQTMAAMKAADAQRAELIGMIDLRSVGSRNGLQAIDS
ncbi:MAG: hypothetical protein WA781_26535, partial [Pseudolabrys sp.]